MYSMTMHTTVVAMLCLTGGNSRTQPDPPSGRVCRVLSRRSSTGESREAWGRAIQRHDTLDTVSHCQQPFG